tara:strand:- start:3481 stop:4305 length:825 start_codon:yes stop_codon:yes gene_type:complete
VSDKDQTLLYELLRSFTILGRTLNLSKTVKQLGTTRQTVRRHMFLLEQLRGEKLFDLVERRYQLTEAGRLALVGAEELLTVVDDWLSGKSNGFGGLSYTAYDSNFGHAYIAQQRPITSLWSVGAPLLQQGFKAWVETEGRLEKPPLAALKSDLVIYRRYHQDWLCVSIGEQTAYANWIGPTFAQSALGLSLADDPFHSGSVPPVQQAYDQVMVEGAVRYDHVARRVPENQNPSRPYLTYQRLLMACRFPDGQPALAILSHPCDQITVPPLFAAP